MLQPLLRRSFLVVLILLTSCSSRRRSAGVTPTEDNTPVALRLTESPAGAPGYILHWRPTGTPPAAYRIYQSDAPLVGANIVRSRVLEVDGQTLSAPVNIPIDTQLTYLAVQPIAANQSAGRLSEVLPIDTREWIAFQALNGALKQVWMARVGEAGRQVGGNGESLDWLPGSRGLGFLEAGLRRADAAIPDIWRGNTDQSLVAAPSLPTRSVTVDWFSMRFAPTGNVAFRAEDGGSVALFVRTPDGNETRVSAGTRDVAQFAWSPDGHSLLYLQKGEALNQHLWFVASDGTDRRRLNADLGIDEYVLSANWSHSGHAVAVQVVDANSAQTGVLSYHVITEETPQLGVPAAHESAWHGEQLYFATAHAQPTAAMGISVYTPSGGSSPRELLRRDGRLFGFRIDPQGRWLAYLHRSPHNAQTAHLLDLGTGTSQPIALPTDERPLRMLWSSGGRKLAVHVQRTLRQALRVMDFTATPRSSTIWIEGNQITHFDWSPLRDVLGVLSSDPTPRLYRADGANLIELSDGLPSQLPILDFTWSNWGMPEQRSIYSTLVSK